jgi:hypothetical protein
MVATTNTMGLVAVHAYPSSVSNTTNISSMLPSTVVRVVNQTSVNQAAIICSTYRPTDVLNFPKVAPIFNRVPNFVPASYLAPPVASIIGRAIDYPKIDSTPRINSIWVQPDQQAVDIDPTIIRDQAINVEQGIWERLVRICNYYYIIIETLGSITETLLRKPIPKITTETNTITGVITTPFWKRALSETKSITETQLRIVIPKIVAETNTISHILNASKTPAEWVVIVDSLLRKVIPKIAAEVKTITGVITTPFWRRALADTETISEALTRVAIHFRTFTETKTISETLVAIAERLIHIVETKTISDSLARSLVGRAISETKTISESIKRKLFPTIATEVNAISFILNASKIPTEFVKITESELRRVIPFISTEVKSISSSIANLYHFFRVITETKSISETQLRKPIPHIATETKSITDILLRTVIPKIVAEVSVISDVISRLATFFRTLVETETISDIISIGGQHVFFTLTETVSITSSFLRTAIPNIIADTVTISDSFLRTIVTELDEITIIFDSTVNGIFRQISQTISISESRLRRVIPTITTQTTIISDSIDKLSHFFRTLAQTTTITEAKLRRIIPNIATEVKSISSVITRRPISTIFDSIVVTDSVGRLAFFFRTIFDYTRSYDRVFGWLVGRIRRIVRIQTCN